MLLRYGSAADRRHLHDDQRRRYARVESLVFGHFRDIRSKWHSEYKGVVAISRVGHVRHHDYAAVYRKKSLVNRLDEIAWSCS